MNKPLSLILCLALSLPCAGQQTEIRYLSGTDAEHTIEWEFFCTGGMNRNKWTTIQVPSQWELQGFGTYNYGHDRPHATEHGLYRHRFTIPETWKDKTVYLVFEGSMTDTDVKVNGQSAGPVHKGGFYRFRYDVSSLLDFRGENLLEVDVAKESADEDINQAERHADYWIFGGIYRPVYLQAEPVSHVDRVAIDARHDGGFRMDVYAQGLAEEGYTVETQIQDASGRQITTLKGIPAGEAGHFKVSGQLKKIKPWTSETPNLYTAQVTLKKNGKSVHVYNQKFGFRTVEFREGDGFYINGTRVIFKGVCRHTFRPEYGRASSKRFAIEDVNLIKDMNMNAVRMSHYPPDPFFLDVCDSLGLYVVDELAGWQSRYDTPNARKFIGDMVERDVNHPSIFLWSNGNEGGFPTDCRDEYAKHDPQGRRLVEPWSLLDGLDARHYPKYDYTVEALTQKGNVYMPTEFLHGLHDGGHGAGLNDYWEVMLRSPLAAGGFLWNYADEGVVRRDQRDSIDVHGNNAPDGILGPHLEKEGSFYAIKQIWSPVAVDFPAPFAGTITLENRYHFTDLSDCSFSLKLSRNPNPLNPETVQCVKKPIPAPRLSPRASTQIQLPLPADWKDYDVLYITATDPFGREIYTWSHSLASSRQIARRLIEGVPEKISVSESADRVRLTQGSLEITFDKANGEIETICEEYQRVPLCGTPHFTGVPHDLKVSSYGMTSGGFRVEGTNSRGDRLVWTLQEDGWIRIEANYVLNGDYDFAGISFSYPETEVKGVRLLADGPYHVWKNRLQGVTAGLYDKPYNNTITGQTWDYPEFKGFYSGFQAVRIETTSHPLTLVSDDEGLYLRLYTPGRPDYFSRNVQAVFPNGDISVLNSIPPVGTKFSRADQEGPSGAKNHFTGERCRFTVYLHVE